MKLHRNTEETRSPQSIQIMLQTYLIWLQSYTMVVTYTTHKRCMSLSMFATRVTTVYSANYVILAKPIEKLLSTQSKMPACIVIYPCILAKPIEKLLSTQSKMLACIVIYPRILAKPIKNYYVCNAKMLHHVNNYLLQKKQ